MSARLLAAASAFVLSCAREDADVLVTRAPLARENAWITAAPDAVEMLTRVLGQRPLTYAGERESRSDARAFLVPVDALLALSELEHEERGRCGGYMLHDSEAEALSALRTQAQPSEHAFLLAPSYTLDNPETVATLMDELKAENVLATVRKLASYRNRFHTSMSGLEAATWIRDSWRTLATGRDDITVELIDHQKTPQPSIALTMRGREAPDEIVVLGGHIDSISGRGGNNVLAPGADDNASGIAVLTELLRAAIELGYRPQRTVIFYGYAAEEVGLVGSAEIAAQAAADKQNIVGVMQLDMTNFTSAATPYITLIRDNTDAALNQFSIGLIETYLKMPWKYYDCGYACSDHASWTQHKFPATFPHEALLKEGNQRIHTEGDTLALSKESVTHSMHFARFGAAFLAELGKGGLAADEPMCSATKPCAAGERCEAGMCTSTSGDVAAAAGCPAAPCAADAVCKDGQCVETNERSDAGGSRRGDGGRSDAGARTGDAADEETPDEEDGAEDDEEGREREEREGAQREGGCTAGATPARGSAGTLLMLLVGLVWRRARSRRHGATKS